ncbi:MAG: zinc ribbon domain-containing protein [Bacteroidota bacterium]
MADFLDKVKQGLDKGVTVVSVRSKEALETARLKSRIADLSADRKQALAELGGMVFARFQQNAEGLSPEVRGKCEVITALDRRIQETETELRQVHRDANEQLGIPVCANCGAELTEDDRFCRNCGQKVAGEQA